LYEKIGRDIGKVKYAQARLTVRSLIRDNTPIRTGALVLSSGRTISDRHLVVPSSASRICPARTEKKKSINVGPNDCMALALKRQVAREEKERKKKKEKRKKEYEYMVDQRRIVARRFKVRSTCRIFAFGRS